MNIKIKLPLIIMIAGIIFCSAARVYLILCTDMSTGFLIHGKSLLCNLLFYGIAGVCAIAAAVTTRNGELCEISEIKGSRVHAIGFVMSVMALLMGYEGILELKALSPSMFLVVIDFLFALIFFIVAFATTAKGGFSPGLGFTYSLMGVYFVLRGIYCFLKRMTITSFPEYLAECVGIIVGAVFMVSLARFFSGNSSRVTRAAVSFWGTLTAVVNLTPAIGAVIMKLFGDAEFKERITFSYTQAEYYFQMQQGDNAYMMTGLYLVNTLLGAFAAVAVAVVLRGKKTEIASEEAANDTQ